ncbi:MULTISPECIES: aminotransferase-like domain-containing protein [Deefgea]|uniref:Putative 8-amino-7-oxononanoate synthase n=1 Tax=Deefgea chitinilytica TaxID=570276 RepID=A0ABS2CFT3_9NEIS|nr:MULTISPECIES: PLP-dependent aminotransferase family protein [Deefgea]MBM5572996.1 aminotransferase class I/II-fold pyridoxal phosphate-dependent enzyme [Deefgea chitinilytica]MBM9890232.1 PLP-dependent aminotransferase family protein [Deefgea sp. CFH1-16]
MSREKAQYRQIADQLKELIRSGKLAPNAKMPSVRALAQEHKVSVMTSLQALRSLEQEQWIEARPKSGFYVRSYKSLHASNPKPFETTSLDEQTELHLSVLGTPCRIRLDLANGETALYPVKKLGILMRQLIYKDPTLLGNHIRGTGYPPLKQQIVRRAFDYGCELDQREIIITNGCIESLTLALRAVTEPGDSVVVESPTYFVILQMLQNLGLVAVEVDCTELGLDLVALEQILVNQKIAALITISNSNNPSGTTPSNEHKSTLISIAERYDTIIIEDDIYGDTHFASTRPKPLRALSKNVILCSSFSKILAPGIRVGWIAGGVWTSKIASLKYSSTMATAVYPQAAIAEFLRTGGYDVHLRKLRKTLQYQIRKMREAIIQYFPENTYVSDPVGGYVLWVRLPSGCINTRELFELSRKEGIGIAPGHLFASDNRYENCFRLNAGFGWDKEVEKAIYFLSRAIISNPVHSL